VASLTAALAAASALVKVEPVRRVCPGPIGLVAESPGPSGPPHGGVVDLALTWVVTVVVAGVLAVAAEATLAVPRPAVSITAPVMRCRAVRNFIVIVTPLSFVASRSRNDTSLWGQIKGSSVHD
jgi:hypothetical protein